MKRGGRVLLGFAGAVCAAGVALAVEVSAPAGGATEHVEPARTAEAETEADAEAPAAAVAAAPRMAPARAATPPAPAPPSSSAAAGPAAPSRRAIERRDALITQLRDTGTAPAPLARAASAVLDGWRATAPAELAGKVELGPVECHAGGCFVEASYPDALAFDLVDHSVTSSAAFQAYDGWRHRAGPIEDGSGKVKATWFFMAAEPR